jgi:hypothetical protein
MFYVIYSQQIQKDQGELYSRWNGGIIVAVALAAHAASIFMIIKKFIAMKYHRQLEIPGSEVTTPLVFVFMFLVIRYFNQRRTNKISEKYADKDNLANTLNYMKVAILIFLPLIVAVIISKL